MSLEASRYVIAFTRLPHIQLWVRVCGFLQVPGTGRKGNATIPRQTLIGRREEFAHGRGISPWYLQAKSTCMIQIHYAFFFFFFNVLHSLIITCIHVWVCNYRGGSLRSATKCLFIFSKSVKVSYSSKRSEYSHLPANQISVCRPGSVGMQTNQKSKLWKSIFFKKKTKKTAFFPFGFRSARRFRTASMMSVLVFFFFPFNFPPSLALSYLPLTNKSQFYFGHNMR